MVKIEDGENLYGKKVRDISQLVNVFEAQEGEIQQIIGKTGNGKTYEGTRRAIEYLKQGYTVYTTWHLILPDYYDEREDKEKLFFRTIFFRKRFYRFDLKNNWHFLDIDREDLVEFVANLTDCIVFLDEGQDIFDSYEGTGMSKLKRKSLTRTRHLRKTLIIISQRAQAVAVTARANVTYFFKCVKSFAWFWPFATYFKVYRTEEMDTANYPLWEDFASGWQAELWHSHFAKKEIYDAYNSWYLRAGIPQSQEVSFEAYDLTLWQKLLLLFRKKRKGKVVPSDTWLKQIRERNEKEFGVVDNSVQEGKEVVKLKHEKKSSKQDRKKSPPQGRDVGRAKKSDVRKPTRAQNKAPKTRDEKKIKDGGKRSILKNEKKIKDTKAKKA